MKRIVLSVLASLLVAGLAAVPGFASGSGPGYLGVTSWAAEAQNDQLAKLSVTTNGAIPRKPDAFALGNPVVGLAWADLDSGHVVVATIHPVLGRDSYQNPDSWHVHTATLAGGATAPNDFCVASIDSTPTAGIAIQGSSMAINIRQSALPVDTSAFDAVVGFSIQGDDACGSGLAVRLVS